MPSNEKLLPCPFCGHDGAMKQGEGKYRGVWYVECTYGACGATTDITFSVKEDAKPIVIDKWNRRPAPVSREAVAWLQEWADDGYAPIVQRWANEILAALRGGRESE